jgi:hypothetical protein
MNTWQVIVRTFVSTIDILLILILGRESALREKEYKIVAVLILLNLAGVWV